ncbi:MAG: nucleotidyltransferase family protein [Thermodesulfobacteria bacterium]|nr:nucleotidyltransferase family protein [Thermodesulfobacteriota bacterium]
MKSLDEIRKILKQQKDFLKEKYKVKNIAIFGSYVRGEQKKTSDIDILVDFYETPDFLTFLEFERFLEELLGIKVDLVRKPALRKEIRERVLQEAQMI